MASDTSRRTARLKRRRRSSISTASSRSSASSSSTMRSALRVTRKAAASSITMPANKRVELGDDEVFDGQEAGLVDLEEAREHRRHLDAGEAAVLAVRIGDHRGDAEREVGDVRERVARVDGERGEHREDPLLVDLDEALLVLLVEVGPAHDAETGVGERRHELVEVDVVLVGDQCRRAFADRRQLLRGGASRRRSAPRCRRRPGP